MSDIKVLLFGLNYEDSHISSLPGCINDVNTMKDYMIRHFKIPNKNIELCHDHTVLKPDRNTIIQKIQKNINLVNDKKNKLNTLWIQYSGHGSYILDKNNDEKDGYDEVLCPLSGQFITDDTLNNLFSKLNSDKQLICIFDCCHSGTALDLTYKYDHQRNVCIKNNKRDNIQCKAILLSACLDKQVAADVSGLLQTFTYNGAFTSSLITAFRKNSKLNIDSIFTDAYSFLKSKNLHQRPQISCNYKIDKNSLLLGEKGSKNKKKTNKATQDKIKLLKKYIRLCKFYYQRTRNYYYIRLQKKYINLLKKLIN